MATAEEILKKAENRKKNPLQFKPQKRRAWDFVFEKSEQKNKDAVLLSDKTEDRLEVKSENTENVLENKSENTENVLENKKENRLGNKSEPKSGYDSEDKQEKEERYLKFIFCDLKGLQLKMFSHLSTICLTNEDLTTGPLNTRKVSQEIGCSYDSAKTTLSRLIKKELLCRLSGKPSRGGFINLYLTKKIKKIILENKLGSNIGNGFENKEALSSSIINIKTTTEELVVPEEWFNIDIEPLTSIGFSKNHLSQIASQNKLSTQIIQDSIHAFAFDIEKNDKIKSIKGDPLNFFMGILRNGKPYTPPSNYESPQDKAMRIYMEWRKKMEQEKEAIEKKVKDLAYKEWFSELTDDQKREFLPEPLKRSANLEKNKFLEGGARTHFETEIWPIKKKEIVQEENITVQGEVTEIEKEE